MATTKKTTADLMNSAIMRNKLIAFNYILSIIDGEAYERELNTDREKVEFLIETFHKEYGHEIKRMGGEHRAMAGWFQGLPSVFNIAFMNWEILALAEKWGTLQSKTQSRQDQILHDWWEWIANKVFVLRDFLKNRDNLPEEYKLPESEYRLTDEA